MSGPLPPARPVAGAIEPPRIDPPSMAEAKALLVSARAHLRTVHDPLDRAAFHLMATRIESFLRRAGFNLLGILMLAFCASARAEVVSCDGCARGRQIQIRDEGLRSKVALALLDAYDRLEAPACRDAFGVDHQLTQQRLSELTFADGAASRVCRDNNGVFAYTSLSTTTVTVCPKFGKDKPEARTATLIHEAFHTTGVEEADSVAGSGAITARVLAVCR